jgi:hypothetical protein
LLLVLFFFINVNIETDPEMSNRLKEDRKYLAKGTQKRALARMSIDKHASIAF